ncbi:MAG: response regulator [Bacteroidales bacterium]|nr:response regulator [Bacteroidales bacterium]
MKLTLKRRNAMPSYKILILGVLGICLSIIFIHVSCRRGAVIMPLDRSIAADSVVALRHLGKELRDESRFEEALTVHGEGLKLAEAIGDTLEWVQALNNVGTDYRRLGMLDLAQDYHYRAWILSEEFSDTSYSARKNRMVSMNGLGNVYLTMGNYEQADSAFRIALRGEQELCSPLGQAINYANLGSIFERRGQIDSAWVSYRLSMEHNVDAGSELGVALCHIHFGSLYEKEHQYEKAIKEYEVAYEMMESSKDEWHSLNTLIALAGIHEILGDNRKTMEYLERAKSVAEQIGSVEHLVTINNLYYRHYKRRGNYRRALSFHEDAISMKDSLLNMEMINRIQNTSLNIERRRQEREMNDARMKLDKEHSMRSKSYFVLAFLLFLIALLLYIQWLRSRSNKALKHLSLLRETLFTNITHEFRTPLTLILGLSQDLQHCEDTGAVKEKASAIEHQGNELLTLINQLLDISKIKSTVINPDWQNGNISAYLMMLVDTYRDYARSRNINLQFIAKGEIEMDFVPDYVNKVMSNLLSNAFKFTPEYGCVDVSVWRVGDMLHIDVSDTGEGMDEVTAAHAFDPFFQAESENHHIGTGVGLALVKQIMELICGTIEVESEVGSGTTFHIQVPIHNDSKRIVSFAFKRKPVLHDALTVLSDDDICDDQCRLLIIEDHRDIAAYIGSQFADRYAIYYATSGDEGLGKALDLVPDLIITDLLMPGMDGLEVCRQVRESEIINHIPIIVVTAKVSEEERIRVIEAGADAYVAKPFNSEELRTLVEKLLDRHSRLRSKYGGQEGIGKGDDNTDFTESERRFLNKTIDQIYLLMGKGGFDVSSLAESLCLSPRQFHRKIIALTGDTPAAYILRIRMKRACQLLESKPEMTIEEVAERCGFEHTSSFYHSFKKTYGITPTSFRRRIGN